MRVPKKGRWARSTKLHFTSEGRFLRGFREQLNYLFIDSKRTEEELCYELDLTTRCDSYLGLVSLFSTGIPNPEKSSY